MPVMANTLFQQHKRLLYTWTSPDVSISIRFIILFAAKDGQSLYCQQKQDLELTVAQMISFLLQNSGLNWRKWGKPLGQSGWPKSYPLWFYPLVAQMVKKSAHNVRDLGMMPQLGRSPEEGNGSPLQYSCLGNLMDRGAWRATVHGVTKSRTWLSD